LAILGVVLNHASSYGFIAMFWWTDRYLPVAVPDFHQMGSFAYYSLRVVEQIFSFSVPSFIFISGFFIALAGGRSSGEAWQAARTRVWGLAVPYLIWSIVTIISRRLLGEAFTPTELLEMVLLGRAAQHYYFIPLLASLYLMSPLLIRAAKASSRWLLSVAAIVQLITVGLHYPLILGTNSALVTSLISLTPGWFFAGNIFWFCLGIVACLHLSSFTKWLGRAKWAFVFAWAVLLVCGVLEWEILLSRSGEPWIPFAGTALDTFHAAAFILAFLAFGDVRGPFPRRIMDLGTKSYGIYLTHGLALTFGAKVIYRVAPWVLAHQEVFMPILIVAGLGLPMALVVAVRRSAARKYYAQLMG
jgi:fucose 4-O-acetylase-like acetyltransferase